MELYFLDKDFTVIDILDCFSSVVWSEKFHEIGTFTLHFPREYVIRVKDAVYVRTSFAEGDVKCGRIECLSVGEDGDCKMSGHLLECLLGDRVIEGSGVYSGTVTDAALSAVRDNLRDCGVVIAEEQPLIEGEVSLSYDYNKLAEWLYTVLKPYGASFRILLDPETELPVFSLVLGEDRSADSSTGTDPAIFSASFGNIVSFTFSKNESGMKNKVYVEGKDGTVVVIDKSGYAQARELHSDADDIDPADFESTDDYKKALYARGLEVLSESADGMEVSAECDADALPHYGTDYSLGDICDVCDNDIGLSFALRLTEVDTVWENNKLTVFPSFGDKIRSIKKLIDRSV